MQIAREEKALPTFGPSEDQALATFNDAAEERRYVKSEQWRIINYALIAFAALTATPAWLDTDSWFYGLRGWVSFGVVVLIWVGVWLVLRNLQRSEASLDRQERRLREARARLLLLYEINESDSRGKEKRGRFLNFSVKPVLLIILILGAFVATLINFSRLPIKQVVVWFSI